MPEQLHAGGQKGEGGYRLESVRVSSGHEPRNRDHKIRDITATARVALMMKEEGRWREADICSRPSVYEGEQLERMEMAEKVEGLERVE